MSAASDAGSVPLQKLVELDSGQHHLREQTDRDRRAQAERNMSFEDKISRIDERVRKHGEQLSGITSSLVTVKWMLGLLAAIIPTAVGAAWALARFVH